MSFKKFSLICLLFFSLSEASHFQYNTNYNFLNYSKNFHLFVSEEPGTCDESSQSLENQFFQTIKNVLLKKIQLSLFSSKSNSLLKTLNVNFKQIRNIKIIGNNIFSNKIFFDLMKKFNIIENKIFSQKQIKKFIEHIKQVYYQQGFLNCCVEIIGIPISHTDVQINVVVREGDISRISKLGVSGNKYFSSKKIKEILLKKKPFRLFNFFSKSIYAPDQFKKRIEELSELYFKHGFLDCRISSFFFPKTKNFSLIDTKIEIHEGSRYKFGYIKILGEKNLVLLKKLQNILNQFKKNFFPIYKFKNIKLLNKYLNNVFLKYGYVDVVSKIKMLKNFKKKKINFIFRFLKGKQTFINQIFLQGSKISQDVFLYDLLKKNLNKYYNSSSLRKCCDLLLDTGLFENVFAKSISLGNFPQQKNICFILKPEYRQNVNISANYNFKDGLTLNLFGWKKNLYDTGYQLTGRIFKNRVSTRGDISLSSPYKFLNFYMLKSYTFLHIVKKKYLFSSNIVQKRIGSEVSVQSKLLNHKKHTIALGYVQTKNSSLKLKIPLVQSLGFSGINLLKDYFEKYQYTKNFYIRSEFKYTTLFPIRYPETGYLFKISNCTNLPYSTNQTYNFTTSIEKYIPLTLQNNIIFHGFAQLSTNIHFLKFSCQSVPLFETISEKNNKSEILEKISEKKNFFQLDENIHNNIMKNNSIPIVSSGIQKFKKQIVLKNQSEKVESFANVNLNTHIRTEFLFPHLTTPIPLFRNFQISVFADIFGNLYFQSEHPILKINHGFLYKTQPHNLHVSSGFLIRWFSPFGPIKFIFSKSLFKFMINKS
ncbi:POTRA domain-containing protein [Buchnera aphidicola]|uniref:Outer membrane protein assembly factor BamA n=1 Tax=Buchnera aphidicola subsp. Tuberolachnus salignus TaxID=98804 RepID=A0A160SXD9_BUCTT|nr:POTRA domain-containing protein [Buchnera aphidicola]CUR53135.1 Outer membrane protein assembly factor BamA [Buchnera aphidicola (Tuberolachnus salignus)]